MSAVQLEYPRFERSEADDHDRIGHGTLRSDWELGVTTPVDWDDSK